MQKATLYKKLSDNQVQCLACKHFCIIQEGKTGICSVRKNISGILYLLVYGSSPAYHIDPIEKKPLFHFLPSSRVFSFGTLGCNFSCLNCQNWELSQEVKHKHEIHGHELPPEKIIKLCKENKLPSIAYTYNEPAIFFEYAYDTARLAKKQGIKNIFVSNGYETEQALRKLHPYLDAMNIDLKSFSEDFYKTVCGAKLANVLETIRLAHKLGIWLELTTLIIPEKNDSDEEMAKIAKFIANISKNIPWHISAFHPNYKMSSIQPTKPEALIRAYNIGKKAGLNFIYTGNIISQQHSSTYCPNCKTLLIRRDGYSVIIEKLKQGRCVTCREKIPGIWE